MEVQVMKNKLIERSYLCEVRTAEDDKHGNIIVGRPIVYESKTDIGGMFAEIIERGALNKTDLTDVRFLVNHDISKIPLARSRKNTENSTMQLIPDDDGLGIRVDLDIENNTEARNLYSAIQRGDISGMSFMFSIDDDEWENLDSKYPTRHIRSIATVVEVSAVTFPAYADTSIAVRDKSALDNARLALENARSSKSVDTDSINEVELLKLRNKNLGGF